MRYSLFHNIDKDRTVDNIWGEYRPGNRLTPYYAGEVDDDEYLAAAETLFMRHNRDNRPCGRLAPSLSIGDVIVFHNGDRHAFACALEGFERVDVDTMATLPESYLEWLETERKERARG